MRFLFPGFLFALITVIIPILIHLFNFRRLKRVYFSNVSFLKAIEQKSSSARKLKRLLLLAVRMLALIFLVLAFARPYIPSSSDSTSAFRQQVVSIYIDNSYSMELLTREGNLLEEAKRRAREIASAYDINDKYQLLTNDFEGRHQRMLNYEDFISALDAVKVSGARRTLQQVINRQTDLLLQQTGSEKTAFLISDFQTNMLSRARLNADSAISCRLVKLEAAPQPNISIDSAWFVSPVHKSGESEKLVVRLKNNSDRKAENVPVKVMVDRQQKAIGAVTVPARSARRDTLSFSGLAAGWRRGTVTITDYPVTFDDRLFFSFYVRPSMSLLVINSGEQNPYVNAVYAAEPFFRVDNVHLGNINYSSLSSYPLIILNGADKISEGASQQLKIYVQNGGSLMVFPSVTEDISALKMLTQTLGTDIPEATGMQPLKVNYVNYQHPLFRGVFEKIPRNVDLPVALKYVLYKRSGRAAGSPLMELQGRRPFLSQYTVGNGHVYLSAVALTEEAANLVRHSFFVPVMYQSAFLSLRDKALSSTIGKDSYIEINRITLPGNQILKLKNEKAEVIPDVRQTAGGTRLFIADQIREAGQYNLLKGDSLVAVSSFNDDREESDLSYASEKDLLQQFSGNKAEVFSPGRAPLKNTVKAVNYGVQLWKLCLILALIFLAAEILLLKFYGRREGERLQQGT